jgi:hypothetical protein
MSIAAMSVRWFVQKAAPGRGGDFGPPWQVSPDRGLADLDAGLEQFAVDAGAPPERVGQAQARPGLGLQNQFDNRVITVHANIDSNYMMQKPIRNSHVVP